jgi:nucleotide-binding universal stress UspA family protein
MTSLCIVVGLDGSSHGEDAAAWARAVASRVGAVVVAVHARGLLEHGGAGSNGGDAPESGPVVSGGGVVVEDGDPVSVLLRVAEERSADLLVVGRRGSSADPDLLLGSTSHQLAERAPCPLVIIPPGAHLPGPD